MLSYEIIELEQKNTDLISLIDSFSDPDTVELEAKRRLNLKKAGEEVVVILRDKNDKSQNIVQAEEPDQTEGDSGSSNNFTSNAIKWWGYITSSK